MFNKEFIGLLLCMITLASFAQGRLWNRGTIQLDAGTEARVHGNIQLDAPVTGDGFLTFTGNAPAQANGYQLQTDFFRMQSTAALHLKTDFSVTQQANFISGVLNLNGKNLIFGGALPTTGGNTSSYIQTPLPGRVKFPVNTDTVILPLGVNAHYIPTVFSQQGAADTFSVQLWSALTDNGTVSGNALSSHVGSWALEITESVTGHNNVLLSFQWPDASLTPGFFEPQSALIFYNGSGYIPLSLCGTDLSMVDPNNLQATGITNVGLFGVADSMYLPPQPEAIITPAGSTVFCQGDSVLLQSSVALSYLWSNGATTQEIYTSAGGAFQVTVTDANGCQSVSAVMDVIVYQPDMASIHETACNEFFWAVTGQTYTANGSYSATFHNQHGCDSVITLHLTIKPLATHSQSFSICPGSSVTVGSNTYDTAGTYTDVLTAQNGCDSTVTTTLTVLDCSGLPDVTSATLTIYPNPATDWLSVVSSETWLDGSLEIWTVQGKLVQSHILQLQPSVPWLIDVRQLSTGVYLLKAGNKVYPFIRHEAN